MCVCVSGTASDGDRGGLTSLRMTWDCLSMQRERELRTNYFQLNGTALVFRITARFGWDVKVGGTAGCAFNLGHYHLG